MGHQESPGHVDCGQPHGNRTHDRAEINLGRPGGKDGAYATGGHATGIKGINGAAGKDPAAIVAVLKDRSHGFTDKMLSAADMNDLALFVSKGQVDPTRYIDAATTISAEDKKKIFEGNARRVFSRLRA